MHTIRHAFVVTRFCLGLTVTALTWLVGCSSADFKTDATTAGSEKEGSERGKANRADASDQESDGTDGANGGSDGDESAFDDQDFGDKDGANITDDAGEPEGCKLPEAIAGAMKSSVPGGLSLSWGGGGTETSGDLLNLDLEDCAWFRDAKAAGEQKYMVLYTDKANEQSHAEPFDGPADPVNYARCLTSAASAQSGLSAGSTITCQFMPLK